VLWVFYELGDCRFLVAVVFFVCVVVLVIELVLSLMGHSPSEGTAHPPLISFLGWIIGAIVALGFYNLIKDQNLLKKEKKMKIKLK